MNIERTAQLEIRRVAGLNVVTPIGTVSIDAATDYGLAYVCELFGVEQRPEDDRRTVRLRIYEHFRNEWVAILAQAAANRDFVRELDADAGRSLS